MNELALFSGAGGGILAAQLLGHRVVCGVECEPYCNETILRRQEEGHLQADPIWPDARTFAGKPWRGKVDILSAGFPCQPFSVAGQRKGAGDERNLWPETLRIISEVGCEWAFLENVPGLLSLPYWGTILGQMAEAGFDAEWMVLGADDCGANHRRKRLWILAHAFGRRCKGGFSPTRRETGAELEGYDRAKPYTPYVSYSDEMRELQPQGGEQNQRGWTGDSIERWTRPRCDWWTTEPRVDRLVYGARHGMDRIASAGLAQVPIVAARAFRILMERYR